MMTVSQISRRGGIAPHVVRYYARIGLLVPARDPGNGYQLFSGDDLERLRFVRRAQGLAYTLEEIRDFMDGAEHGAVGIGRQMRELLEQRLRESRCKRMELEALERRIRRALAIWDSLGACGNGPQTVRAVVEAVSDDEVRVDA